MCVAEVHTMPHLVLGVPISIGGTMVTAKAMRDSF